MKTTGVLLIGSMMFMAGCAAEVGNEAGNEGDNDESEQTQVSALEANKITPATTQFVQIRVSNTNFCVWPQGGSPGNVPLELHPCNRAQTAQNWVRVPSGGGNELVNQVTGKCIYYGGVVPIVDYATPILQNDCNVFGSTAIATNSIWRLDRALGLNVFESKLSNKDTNFCLDVPKGETFTGQHLQMRPCTREPQQQLILE